MRFKTQKFSDGAVSWGKEFALKIGSTWYCIDIYWNTYGSKWHFSVKWKPS